MVFPYSYKVSFFKLHMDILPLWFEWKDNSNKKSTFFGLKFSVLKYLGKIEGHVNSWKLDNEVSLKDKQVYSKERAPPLIEDFEVHSAISSAEFDFVILTGSWLHKVEDVLKTDRCFTQGFRLFSDLETIPVVENFCLLLMQTVKLPDWLYSYSSDLETIVWAVCLLHFQLIIIVC